MTQEYTRKKFESGTNALIPGCLTMLMISTVLAGAAQDQGKPTNYYYYFKEKRPLELNLKKIALYRGGLEKQGLPSLGIGSADEEAMPVTGWSVAGVPVNQQTDLGIRNLTAEAPRQENVRFVSPVFTITEEGEIIVTPSIIVRFTEDTSSERAEEILQASGCGSITDCNWAGMEKAYKLAGSSANGFEVLAAANALAELPEVLFAEPDFMFTGQGSFIPNDTGFSNCWGIHNTGQVYRPSKPAGTPDMDMDGPEAWDITTGDPCIVVVVIDTGVQQDHPDINQRPGADFTTDGGDGGPVNQYDNHGTPVGGCVSATINNALGTVGIAPNSLVASARTFIGINSSGSWTSQASWTVNALGWAESIGAKVTNNSNVYGFTSSSIATKYEQTRNNGMVHFACAGNSSSPTLTYPASLATVNAVASLDSDGSLSSFSNYGIGLAFSAPGRDIYSTDRTDSAGWTSGDYVYWWGTSSASPYAAGIAALIVSVDPTLTATEVEQVLQNSSVDLGATGYDTTFGWGFVNAYNAVLQAVYEAADLDDDGEVNFVDFAILADQWLQAPGSPSADIAPIGDSDGIVDFWDLGILVDQWLQSTS